MRLEFFQAAAISEARLVDNETTLGPARLANGPGKNQETTLFHEMLGPVYTIIVLRFFSHVLRFVPCNNSTTI